MFATGVLTASISFTCDLQDKGYKLFKTKCLGPNSVNLLHLHSMGAGGPTNFSAHAQATQHTELRKHISVSQTAQISVMNDLGRIVTKIKDFWHYL